MGAKQLAYWIQSEEAKGYDEGQLRTYLLQKGYPAQEIKEAIADIPQRKDIHSLSNYTHSASPILIGISCLAFLFLWFFSDTQQLS